MAKDSKAPVRAQHPPIKVDNRTKRSDADVLEGHFARLTTGVNAGLVGTFDEVVEHGDDGYPVKVKFLTRNQAQSIIVKYADLHPVAAGGR